MRIKKFESYHDRFYYKNPEASEQIKDSDVIDMSQTTYERLMKIYGSRLGEKDSMDYGNYPSFDDEEKYFYGIYLRIKREDLSCVAVINELSDEWFTLELFVYVPMSLQTTKTYLPDESGFWSCDGFEGLVRLIGDLGIFSQPK